MALKITYQLAYPLHQNPHQILRNLHSQTQNMAVEYVSPYYVLAQDDFQSPLSPQDFPFFPRNSHHLNPCYGESPAFHALKYHLLNTAYQPIQAEGFAILPAYGCQWACFSLAQYPHLNHWHFHTTCITQFASNPLLGGIPNFLQAHKILTKILDLAQDLNLIVQIEDCSNYYQHRNETELQQFIQQENQRTAAWVGGILNQKQQGPLHPVVEEIYQEEKEILHFPDFEHLEAKGQQFYS